MNVFIDCGAHKGESTRRFTATRRSLKGDWRLYAFEANPDLCKSPVAVWTEDGEKDFYLAAADDEGSSLIASKVTGGIQPTPIRVPCINFGAWLRATFTCDAYIVLQMNIEGAEYEVFNSMLADGSIDLISELFIEFHNKKINVERRADEILMRRIRERGVQVVEACL